MQIEAGKTYITQGGWEAEVYVGAFGQIWATHKNPEGHPYEVNLFHYSDGLAFDPGYPDYDLVQEKGAITSFWNPGLGFSFKDILGSRTCLVHDFPNNGLLKSWCRRCDVEGEFDRATGQFLTKS